jgi:transcriptional regulator with PAS, ATPase and Fis domain
MDTPTTDGLETRGAYGPNTSSPASQNDAPDLLYALRHRKPIPEHDNEEQSLKETLGVRFLVGQSPQFREVTKRIPPIARCDVTVLVLGETGTGKELCARAIHYLSARAQKPFVPVNCGAIPCDLVENELFGHVQGAFTGACATQGGVIDEANGGTLFLDEIDCLPLLAQVKLLRFLQGREYRPLGAAKSKHAHVRIIAAANIDVKDAVHKGKFRQDLYYRISVLPLELPPLRDRRLDIPLLAQHFLRKYAAEFDKPVTALSEEAVQVLLVYDWPGNVRELEHVIERAVVLSEHTTIDDIDIPLPRRAELEQQESFQSAKAKAIVQFENGFSRDTCKNRT